MPTSPNPKRVSWLKGKSQRAGVQARRRREARLTPGLQLLETRQLMAILLVTNTADSGLGSLRQAILDADGSPGSTIDFSIGSGAQTISPHSVLPDLTGTTTIDGTSQPGYVTGTPLIQIDGSLAGGNVNGLILDPGAGGSMIRGLIISDFTGNDYGLFVNCSNTTIQGNWIGTNAAGTAAAANGGGITLQNANNDLIGTNGDGVNDAAEQNVISGNTSDGIFIFQSNSNTVAGNYIGTNAAGTVAVGNGSVGVQIAAGGSTSNNNIIGTNGSNDAYNADEKNVISANSGGGVSSDGANTVVAGNWIGLNVSGAALGNGGTGVNMTGANGRIGTNADGIADADERNVIDPNNTWGITVGGAGDVVAGNYVGTDPTGTIAFPSTGRAVEIGSNVTLGGTTAADRNVIAGSTYGVYLNGVANSTIVGNYIGTNAAGTGALPNNTGVYLLNSANNNIIGGATAGAGNVISGNNNFGVLADGAGTINNTLLDNLIGVKADQSGNLANGGGSLSLTNGAVVQAGGTFNGAISDAGTLDLDGNAVSIVGALTGTGTVTNSAASGTATLSVNGTGTFSGIIQDGLTAKTAMTVAGGTETLSGVNTYSGATSIGAGTLKAGTNNAIPSGSDVNVANVVGSILNLNGFNDTIHNLLGGGTTGGGVTIGTGTLTVTADGSIGNDYYYGAISGAGNFTLTGGASMISAGNLSYSGTTTLQGTQLAIVSTGTLGTGNVVLNGANLAIDVDAGQTRTLSSVISGSGSLAPQGAGSTLILSAVNTFTGGVYFAGGTLRMGVDNALAPSTTISFYNNGETLDLNGHALTISGLGDLVGSNNSFVTLGGGTLTYEDSSNSAYSGVISGSGAFVQAGSGRLTLTGNNAISGTTTISTGAIQVGNGGTTGSLGSGAVVDNSTLTFDRSDTVSITNAISGTGTLNLTSTGGAISQSAAISVATVVASAATGITLATPGDALSTFTATNSTSGNVSLTNTIGTLTIDGIGESGGTVTVNNTGSVVVAGTVSAAGGSAIGLTSTGTLSEAGSGLISTTGTASISSSGGANLGGANAISSLTATNTTGGAISLTNTSTTLTVTGITQSGTAAGSDVTINQTGALSTTGAISTTATANGAITVTSSGTLLIGANVTAGGSGNLTLSGNLAGLTTGNFVGVNVNAATVQSTSGVVLLEGTGGNSGTINAGVEVQGGGIVQTTGTGGSITIMGTGGSSTGNNDFGVDITGTGSKVTSNGDNVSITGQGGGTGSATMADGVFVAIGGTITSGGSGTVTVQATGGAGTGFSGSGTGMYNVGVWVDTTGMITSGGGGAVAITGTGGSSGIHSVGVYVLGMITSGGGAVQVNGQAQGPDSGSTTGACGVDVFLTGEITAGGTGTVNVQGTGRLGSGSFNFGVGLFQGAKITSSGGNVQVTGQGEGDGGGGSNMGVYLNPGTITAGGTGSVTVHGTAGGGTGGNNYGVGVLAGSITSTGGDVTITGQGNAASATGIFVASGTSVSAPGANNLFLTATGATTGGISILGTASSATGTITTNAAGALTETGGHFSTTGTLTTTSATGQTLTGPNTVGNFLATNSINGAISLTNTATTLTVVGVSETGGTVTLNNTGNIVATGTISAGAGQNLGLTASGALSESGGGSVSTTGAGTITLSAGSTGIGSSGSPFVVSGNNLNSTTSGNGNQFLSTTGTTTIGSIGLNAGTGTVELDGGTFTDGGSNRINDSTKIDVNGSTFSIGPVIETVGTVNLTTGSITGTTGVLTSANTIQTQSGTISAILAGTNGLTQSTAGTTTLTGNNSYSGGTSVFAGTLLVQGTAGTGAIAISSGATLNDQVIATSDSGLGSLRQAITNADLASGAGANLITFNIAGSGVQTISPLSSLPAITKSVVIDGTTQAGYGGSPLIQIDGASSGGSPYGLDVTGGGGTIEGLIISDFHGANAAAIDLIGNGNTVQGNWIGTNAAGTTAAPNSVGIAINGTGNTIGGIAVAAANIIAFNTGDGVQVTGGTANPIRGNAIYSNRGAGDRARGRPARPSSNALGGLGAGPNLSENFPVLDSVDYASGSGTTIIGDINTAPNTTVFVDLYANPGAVLPAYGQGQVYLGTAVVTTGKDGGAQFSFNAPALANGAIISATATDAAGNTSEFGLDFAEDNPPSAIEVARVGATAASTFNVGQSIAFDGTGSASPDGYPLTYSWDFGDHASASGASPTHAYAYDGTYVVTLTVNDGHGGIEATTEQLTIARVPLAVGLNSLPAIVSVGTPLAVTGVVSDAANNPVAVVIAWGDGSAPTTLHLPAGTAAFSTSHTFTSLLPGNAPAAIAVTATDAPNPAAVAPPPPLVPLAKSTPFDAGGSTGHDAASVALVPPPISVSGLSLSGTSILENGSITLTGNVVDAYPLASHTVTITWGESPSSITTLAQPAGQFAFAASHQYLNNPAGVASGAFPVGVSVTSSYGQSATASASVTVSNVAPSVAIQALAPTGSGSLVSLLAVVTDPGTLDAHTYQWSVNGARVPSATQPGFTFNPQDFASATGGQYLVSLSVADDVGATATVSTSLLIGPTTSNHAIVLKPSVGGQVAETVDSQTVGTFTPGNSVTFYTQSTHNVVTIDPALALPAELISTPGGSNTLVGGSGDDTLFSARGLDTLIGTTGPTTFTLVLSGQDPVLDGSTGVNTIDLSQTPQDVTLDLGSSAPQAVDGGGDVVQLASGTFQKAIAGSGNDVLYAASAVPSTLVGGAGNDMLYGSGTGGTSVVGGSGNTTVVGGGGNSVVYGSTGSTPSIIGGSGNTTVVGGGGNSVIYGSASGSTSVVGGSGNSTGGGRRQQLRHLRQRLRRRHLGGGRLGQHDRRRRRRQLGQLRQRRRQPVGRGRLGQQHGGGRRRQQRHLRQRVGKHVGRRRLGQHDRRGRRRQLGRLRLGIGRRHVGRGRQRQRHGGGRRRQQRQLRQRRRQPVGGRRERQHHRRRRRRQQRHLRQRVGRHVGRGRLGQHHGGRRRRQQRRLRQRVGRQHHGHRRVGK